jgi:hypothetical protein
MKKFFRASPTLYDDVKEATGALEPFRIISKQVDEDLNPLRRMLSSFCGELDNRSAWRTFRDAQNTASILACWGLAVEQRKYKWTFEDSGSEIVMSFDPPNLSV